MYYFNNKPCPQLLYCQYKHLLKKCITGRNSKYEMQHKITLVCLKCRPLGQRLTTGKSH